MMVDTITYDKSYNYSQFPNSSILIIRFSPIVRIDFLIFHLKIIITSNGDVLKAHHGIFHKRGQRARLRWSRVAESLTKGALSYGKKNMAPRTARKKWNVSRVTLRIF